MTLDLKMKNTFSYRVLKIFLVLLIFVYLLYYRIYHAGYDMLTSEISRSLYSKATYLTDTMEEEIGRIQRLEYECVNEDTLYYTINTYSIMKKSEKIKKLLEIQRAFTKDIFCSWSRICRRTSGGTEGTAGESNTVSAVLL